jgi:1-acyl-sn-glycerol-3-phosphate acyltransferase
MTFYDAHRVPLQLLFSLLTRVHAEGVGHMPTTGGLVVVSNHLTYLDPLLLGVLFPRQLHFMAKEEIFAFKPLGAWLRWTGTFPVRRGAVDRKALREAEDLLRAGEVVMVFPEGHRSATIGAQAARAGAVLLASRVNVPILPVGIAGTEQLRLRGEPLHLAQVARRLRSRPRVSVRVGPPFMAGSDRTVGRKAGTDELMRRVIALLPPAYRGVYAES